MTSSKSVTEQLEGRCVIGGGGAPSGHEADEQLAASNRPSRPEVIQYACFRWIKAPSAHSDHCIRTRGEVVLVEMDVARTKTLRVLKWKGA